MKGPSIDSHHLADPAYSAWHNPIHQTHQNEASYLNQHWMGNSNHNNSGARFPYGQHGPQMMGHPNVQVVQQEPEPAAEDPFAEYAWMADEAEFERQVLEQMEQEEFFEACVQQICQDEVQDEWSPFQGDQYRCQRENEAMRRLTISEPVSNSALNPNAVEFVPRRTVKQQ